jgi:hypothetical protein
VNKPVPLPWHARAALITCTVLAALVGVNASGDIARLRHLSEIPSLLPAMPLVSPEAVQKAEAVARASMLGMRSSRLVVLTLLCIACTVTFLTVLRLWRPLGLPRAGVLRLASFAALVCALLRTIDGAQDAVIFRRIAAALAEGLSPALSPAMADPETARLVTRLWPDLQMVVHVGLTALVAGAFAVLSQYFRSQRAQKLFTAGDPA